MRLRIQIKLFFVSELILGWLVEDNYNSSSICMIMSMGVIVTSRVSNNGSASYSYYHGSVCGYDSDFVTDSIYIFMVLFIVILLVKVLIII